MTPSARIITFIKGFEKLRLGVYMPTPNDRPTIGWGSTGPDIFLGMPGWTPAQADERFASDLRKFSAGVDRQLTGPTNQNQYDAIVSLAYNIGLHGFCGSSVLHHHNLGNYGTAKADFAMWVKQNGETLAGLVRRRADEALIYGEVI